MMIVALANAFALDECCVTLFHAPITQIAAMMTLNQNVLLGFT